MGGHGRRDRRAWRWRASSIRKGGFLREFFDADWRPAAGEDGRLVEPGHQFEWAWLLARWGRSARRGPGAWMRRCGCIDIGVRGVDRRRGVAVDELNDDCQPARRTARGCGPRPSG